MKQTFTKFIMLLIAITLSMGLMAADQVVTSNGDSGAGTLRQAIIDAGDGDEITFNLSSGNETITITSELAIAESLTIDGTNTAGSGVDVTIQVTTPGTSTYRVFNINATGKTINISNLTIKGGDISGSSANGGGIYHQAGTLILDFVTVLGSKAYDGGGIYNSATLSLTNSTINSNTSTRFGGGISNKGGSGILTLTNSTLNSNTAGSHGGGIMNEDGTITLTNSTVNSNTTSADGGGIYCIFGSYHILNSIIVNNTNNGASDIYISSGGGTVNAYYIWYGTKYGSINGSNNTTASYAANDLSSLSYNGGFANTSAVSSAGNASSKAGSGVRTGSYDDGGTTKYAYSTDGTIWTKLEGGGSATGVTEISTDQRGYYRTSSAITRGAYQYNGIVAKNGSGTSWTGDSDVYSTIKGAYDDASTGITIELAGTAIYESGIALNASKTVTIRRDDALSTTTYVQAAQTAGTALNRVFNISSGTITLEDMTIRNGKTPDAAWAFNAEHGGGIYNTGALTIEDCTVSYNRTGDGGGNSGPFSVAGAGGFGAGLYSTGSLTISGSSFSHNTTGKGGDSGGGNFSKRGQGGDGAGIYTDVTSAAISNSTFTNNTTGSSGSGGMISNVGGTGAGIHHKTGTMTIDECTLSENTSSYCGGAIENMATLSITNSTISGNTGINIGGGISSRSGTLTVTNCTMSGNNLSGGAYGGGGMGILASTVTVSSCTFANNSTTLVGHNGGGILLHSGTLEIINTIIANNSSEGTADFHKIDGTLTNSGYNAVETQNGTDFVNGSNGCITGTTCGDYLSTTLADNGGATMTLAIESGSVAILAGVWDGSITTDQRGESRREYYPTIGAYEFQITALSWTGASSSDWNTTSNWNPVTLPITTDDITIPDVSGKALAPVIDQTGTANCNDLTIESGGSLTIQSGISGTGSLITSGIITNDGTVNVERYVSESIWHLISVPNNVTTANTFLGDYLQTWNETTATWTDITEPTTALSLVKGYGFWGTPDKAKTYTFTGTPNTGNQSITVTAGGTGGSYNRANLLGNPYPSSIDWATVIGYGAVYYWNGTVYLAYPEGTGSYGTGSQYVPPMQGFFIVASAAGDFNLTNSNRTHSGAGNYYKSSKEMPANSLMLKTTGNNYSDELYIRFDETSSADFELQNDAWKLLSSTEGLSQLYSFTGDKILSIDVRPEAEVIQLGFQNNQNGIYSISIKEIADISEATLEDTKTNIFHNLQTKPYEFTWDIEDDEKRFKLHLDAVGIEEPLASESSILVYAADDQIFIKGAVKGQVIVSDMMGRVVLEESISGSELTTIPANLGTGVYVVSVHSGTEIKTEKVFIK